MKRILAVDWDRHEVRYVLTTRKGENLRVLAAQCAPLPETDGQHGGELPPELGETLKKALAGTGIARVVTLVGVDRASVELMHFTLPPAKDGELPELVSNELLRESPSGIDQAVFDFVPLTDDPADVRKVSAAVISRGRLEQIQAACATAGLKPDRLLMRSHAAVSLFLRTATPAEKVCLLVNPVADEVELTVLHGDKVVLSRTARLPEPVDWQQTDRHLLTEIKRTLAVAVQGELGVDAVEGVYVFCRVDECSALLDQIRDELALPVHGLDPFKLAKAGATVLPEGSERFASLLGMALEETHGAKHAIDFLHPRQPDKSFDRRRAAVLAAIVAAAAVLFGGYLAWDALDRVHAHNAKLTARLNKLGGSVRQALEQQQLMESIRNWQAGDVLWLEELRELSLRFPSRRDAMILQMSIRSMPDGGGTIALQGLVRDSSVVLRMESSLSDRYHRLYTNRVNEGSQTADYARRFETFMRIAKRDKSQYLPEQATPENRPRQQLEPAAEP